MRELWISQQEELRQRLLCVSQYDEIQYIGGLDISFAKDSKADACVCLVVLDYNNLERVIYQKCQMIELTQPYIPGFLAFRECDAAARMLEELRETEPALVPQVIMLDGNGILHPRGFGLASHFGVVCEIPTFGVAKTFLWIEDLAPLRRESIREMAKEQLTEKGSYFLLQGKSKTIYGAGVRVSQTSSNPVFVSTGHRVSLEDAMEIAIRCSRYRIPEPVRQADLMSRDFLRKQGRL